MKITSDFASNVYTSNIVKKYGYSKTPLFPSKIARNFVFKACLFVVFLSNVLQVILQTCAWGGFTSFHSI
jgi:hypothetical protein